MALGSTQPLVKMSTRNIPGSKGGRSVRLTTSRMSWKSGTRWCHWIFQWHISFRPYHGPGIDSAPSENEYQEHFLGVKAAGAWGWQPHHIHLPIVMKSGSLNLLEPSGSHRACYGTDSAQFDANCVATTWIPYRCVPCHPWCTHRTSLVVKKDFFQSFCGREQFL